VYRMAEIRNAYKMLVRKYERKGCANNIKMDHKGIRCDEVHRIHLTQGRIQWLALANTVMDCQGQ
jgi:hypothetical protein